VAANGRLRQALAAQAQATGVKLFLPPLSLCTDNAAMVAALGYQLIKSGQCLDISADVFSRG
jgi:N6-L-threonylcarbamoyladenine synthase